MGPVEVLWDGMGYPPPKGHGTSGSIMGWTWGKPPPPLWTDKQTETITFPYLWDAGIFAFPLICSFILFLFLDPKLILLFNFYLKISTLQKLCTLGTYDNSEKKMIRQRGANWKDWLAQKANTKRIITIVYHSNHFKNSLFYKNMRWSLCSEDSFLIFHITFPWK